MEGDKVVTEQEGCIGCGACVTGCKTKAVRMVRRSAEGIAIVNSEITSGAKRLAKMTKMDPLVLQEIKKNR